MKKLTYETQEEVLLAGQEAIGIPLREIDQTGRIKNGKGAVGTVMEESWFGYSVNSESRPDFPEAGVELKVTPFIRTKKGIRAKERLVCNIIDYMDEHNKAFFESNFWKKCNTMLLMSYEHKEEKGDIIIEKAVLFKFPKKDLEIIKDDWHRIIKKVLDGKAHDISEGDTLYLGACTKGANSKSVRKQPFSNIPAKQRAYSLKQSYMTYVLNNYIFGDKEDEAIIKDPTLLSYHSFENYILEKTKPYIGRTQESLLEEFGLINSPKNINELILAKILGVKGKVSATEEFKKANIVPKTIRVNKDGSVTESMSFRTFDFCQIVEEDWETSEFKSMLEQTKFLFVILRYQEDGALVFDDLIFWNMPEDDLLEVKNVWNKTVKILREGVELTPSHIGTANNLPKARDNRVAHVRPHAKDSKDQLPLPDGRLMTKQSFWLNNTYIANQIEKHKH